MIFIYEAGGYRVRQLELLSCRTCRDGWDDGTLVAPADGGPKCTHGRGRWVVGTLGPRGGWRMASPMYGSRDAAILVCRALARAAGMPPEGVS